MLEKTNTEMIKEIKEIILNSRKKVAYEVNNTILHALECWKNYCRK